MKRPSIVRVVVCAFSALILAAGWKFAQLEFSEHELYSENDWLKYEFYTPELFKKMPKISDTYEYEFTNISGPEAHVFTITFKGADSPATIRNYLSSKGFQSQSTCDVEAECWRSPGSKDVITVANSRSEKAVFVQIYRRPSSQPESKFE